MQIFTSLKENDLKASLDKIQPREELIRSTLAKAAKQRERRERRFILPSYSQSMRLAGAVCAFALVFCIGFIAARQDFIPVNSRTLGQLEITDAVSNSVSTLSLDDELENGWIVLNGNISSMYFVELTSADESDGAIRRCKISISANGLIEHSDELSVDLDKADAEFEADLIFYDNDIMNSFFDQSTGEMIFKLTPDNDGNWCIVEFAPFQK